MLHEIGKTSLSFIQSLLNDQVITAEDLSRFVPSTREQFDPEYVRADMENWYRTLGIEYMLGRSFALSRPPFTRDEIIAAHEKKQIMLCVPKKVTRQQMGQLFHFSSWALHDELVGNATENEDFWFTTKTSLVPELLNRTGNEVKQTLDNEGLIGMSLNRYMVFAARMRYVTGQTPDQNHWVWLTRGRYDQKGMLIAGFDALGRFSVHAWLPHFQGARCGRRAAFHPDHL